MSLRTMLSLLCLALGPARAYEGWNVATGLQASPLSASDAARKFRAARPSVRAAKLFHYDRAWLEALVAEGFSDIVVDVPNFELNRMDFNYASNIAAILEPFARQGVRITVGIGNEATAPWYGGQFVNLIVPALQTMRSALVAKGLGSVRLTVPLDAGILGSSYPPETGTFRSDIYAMLRQVAQILRDAGSPFFINFYPFFALLGNPGSVSVPYATLSASHTVNGVTYPTMLDAFVAALRAALVRADSSLTNEALPIVVGETGWPTGGHAQANLGNARTFVENVLQLSGRLDVFLFELFDESRKSGDETERHFGMLTEDGTPKWDLPMAISWTPSEDGIWAFGCDFQGQDISSAQVPGSECSKTCKATAGCTHYAWSTYKDGTCWMKNGAAFKQTAIIADRSVVCGINNDIVWNGNWANGCDFFQGDLSNARSPAYLCSDKCANTAGCTHYAWTRYDDGTCWMKTGGSSKEDAFHNFDDSTLCGVL